MRKSLPWIVFAVCLCPSLPALALTPQMVEQAKKATALVELPQANGKAFGSAFCIDASGLFVTNAHVADAAQLRRINLILSPGETDQRIVSARVLKSDKQRDLALLQADDAKVVAPLALGQIGSVFDAMEVTAFGYPFGDALTFGANEYPAVSVSTGHVTSLRKKGGTLEVIQLDAVLNPGNSGGPVLDGVGHVVGIVRSGVPGAGINFAVPVDRLQRILATPAIMVVPVAPIEYLRRFSEHQIAVKVVSFDSPSAQFQVELSIRAQGAAARTYFGQTLGGACDIGIVPVARSAEAKFVPLTAKFKDGTIAGRVIDHNINVGEDTILLSRIRNIVRSDATSAVVTLANGKQISGAIRGLDAVVFNFGELNSPFSLAKAADITIADSDGPVHSLEYHVTLLLKGEVVGEDAGTIEIAGAPDAVVAVDMARNSPVIDPDIRNVTPAGSTPVAQGQPIETVIAGGKGGGHYHSQAEPPQDVIGFRYQIASWGRRPILKTFDCLYDRLDAGQPGVVVAKPGYVVGAVLADTDIYVHAVRIVFMRCTDGVINIKDRYITDWIGSPCSGSAPKMFAGHGEHVVGICGHKGLNFDAIGLIIIPQPG